MRNSLPTESYQTAQRTQDLFAKGQARGAH
jgi:hypothetical protein